MNDLVVAVLEVAKQLRRIKKEDLMEEDINEIKDLMRQLHAFIGNLEV